MKITTEQLAEILDKHLRWLEGREGGSRADLRGAVLRGADLRGAVLSGADLSDADLRGADLRGADLRGADLRGAVLRGADLRDAVLSRADLRDAVLSRADLRDAVLSRAVLSDAVLSDLQKARLSIVPEAGQYTGWKKCRDGKVVRLTIPAEARRSNATGRKCRAEFAVVEAIFDRDGNPSDEAFSQYDEGKTAYRVGETVRCHEWCEDRWQECAGGIHHFITRAEAEDWNL